MRALRASPHRRDAWGLCAIAVDPAGTRDARRVAGRRAAREALRQVGVDPADALLVARPDGAPRWPTGTVGSIAHTTGWSGAAVVRPGVARSPVVAVGLDAEARRPVDPEVLGVVASRTERMMLQHSASRRPDLPWDLLLVTAKEAAYKAAFHLTNERLDWQRVEVDLASRGFSALVHPEHHAPVRVQGRVRADDRLVIALGLARGRTGRRGDPSASR